MPRGKSTKLKPFQKLLTVMASGQPVTIAEIEATLGKEIYMYRISTYMWHVKSFAGGVVKSIKDGRRVTAYQLMNVDEVKKYMKTEGILQFVPSTVDKKPSISKLADLKAKPVAKNKAKANQTAPVEVKSEEPVVEEPVVPEATSGDLVISEVTE